MEKREIKFNAWVPDLGLMLQGVTVYADGMMGMCVDDFQSYIDGMPKHIQFIDDGVYHADDDHFDLLLTILPGEDWLWIDEGDFVPLQYTERKDIKNTEIYDGDIVHVIYSDGREFMGEDADYKDEVYYDKHCASFLIKRKVGADSLEIDLEKSVEVIGNKYENPELCGGN